MSANLELLSQQSRCIAHEIRNQVSICDVYCEIIRKQLEKQGIQNDSISRAVDCIQKSVKIISNSLIDLKSINNYTPKQCSIKSLIDEGIRLANVYIHEKDIKINSVIKQDGIVNVDENKFLACVINLIKNAIEAIETKGEILISAEIKDKIAQIKFSNNGKAIPSSAQKEIFEEGYTSKKTGSGLGLFICRKNLAAQNADLELTRSTEHKTEFTITIPVQ